MQLFFVIPKLNGTKIYKSDFHKNYPMYSGIYDDLTFWRPPRNMWNLYAFFVYNEKRDFDWHVLYMLGLFPGIAVNRG